MLPLVSGVTGTLGTSILLVLCVCLLVVVSWKMWTRRYSQWESFKELPWLGCILSFPYDGHAFFKLCKAWFRKYNYLTVVTWWGFLQFLSLKLAKERLRLC